MARLFLAVYPPPNVVEELSAMPRETSGGVRWVPPEQLHVTLRFLADADPEEVQRAVDAAAEGLRAAGVTLGPRVRRLGRNVVCVPASGLEDVAGVVAGATAHLAEPPDERPFHGHVTLARLRRGANSALVGTPFEGHFVADEVHLVASVARADGPEHRTLHVWTLPG